MKEKEEVEEPEAEEEQEEVAETVEETEIEEEPEEVPEKEGETAEEAEKEAAEVAEEMPSPTEEEAKPPSREEKREEEEEIVEERIYTVPLGKAWIEPANRRASRAMRILESFIVKHMKLEKRTKGEEEEEEEEPRRLVIENSVNERIWRRGIEKPPRKIRVRATKDKEGNVTVHLAEGD